MVNICNPSFATPKDMMKLVWKLQDLSRESAEQCIATHNAVMDLMYGVLSENVGELEMPQRLSALKVPKAMIQFVRPFHSAAMQALR